MSPSGLPDINALLDVSLIDGSSFPSRVEGVDGDTFTVAAPYGIRDAERPEIGALLEMAWLVEESRMGAPVRLAAITRENPPRWQVKVVGEARRKTRRAYVRGGGGERVRLTRLRDGKKVEGRVTDISEGGIRSRLLTGGMERDDRLEVVVSLGDEDVKVAGRVLFERRNAETEDYDLVITYETNETTGRLIRGYILRRQMEERRRMSGAD